MKTSYQRLIVLSVSLIFIILLSYLLTRKKKNQKITLFIIYVIFVVLEIIRQLENGFDNFSVDIPLFPCSIPLYFFPLFFLVKNERVKIISSTVNYTFCVMSFAIYIIAGYNTIPCFEYLMFTQVRSFLYHLHMLLCLIVLYRFKLVSFNIKDLGFVILIGSSYLLLVALFYDFFNVYYDLLANSTFQSLRRIREKSEILFKIFGAFLFNYLLIMSYLISWGINILNKMMSKSKKATN